MSAINRYLKKHNYPTSITDENVFVKLEKAMVAKAKNNKGNGQKTRPCTSDAYQDQDIYTCAPFAQVTQE